MTPPAQAGKPNHWLDLAAYALGTAVVLVTLTFVLALWQADPGVPIHYALGGDADFFLALFKNVSETGWYTTSPRLGAPGTMDLHDFPDAVTGVFATARLLSVFTSNYIYVYNIYNILTYVFVFWAALFACRRLGLSRAPALCVGLLFTFTPYHFYRGMNHPHYASYHAVPLATVTCLWLIEGKPIFLGRRGARKRLQWARGRTGFAIAAAVLLSISGPYYALFGAMLIVAAGAIALFRRPRRWRGPAEAAALAALVLGLLAAQLVPFWAYSLRNGPNPQAVRRNVSDYYSFGLSLNNLLMPSAWHSIEPLRKLSLGHEPEPAAGPNSAFHGQNEAVGSNPLGLAGSVGLLALIVIGITNPGGLLRRIPHSAALASLTLATLFLFLSGGVSEFVALHITSVLRSYNRTAVFLAFNAFLALGLLADRLRLALKKTIIRGPLFGLVVLCATGFALQEQIPDAIVPDHDRNAALFSEDEAFVRWIESQLAPGSAVFQLPVVPFPEGTEAAIMPYDHLRGYLHSRTLRWSFGAVKGRKELAWQQSVAAQPVPEMLNRLRSAGFSGIYVNRQGYPDQGYALLRDFRSEGVTGPYVSRDGQFYFFRIPRAR